MKNFNVYNASAGSGKTTVIAIEFIILSLMNPDKFRRILAITFTNKASAEMKQRIIDYLIDLASGDCSKNKALMNNMAQIRQRTKLNDSEINLRAVTILQNILHRYSEFSVKTIDSFMHKIIKSFANDINLSPDFEIELDEKKLLTESVDLLIDKVGFDVDITKTLIDFAEDKADDDKSWHIENDLLAATQRLTYEETFSKLSSLKNLNLTDFEKIKQQLYLFIKSFEDAIIGLGQSGNSLILATGLDSSAFHRGKTGIYSYFERLAEGKFKDDSNKLFPNTYVQETINDNKWFGSKASAEQKAAIGAIEAELRKNYLNIEQLINEKIDKYTFFKETAHQLFKMSMLNQADMILQELKFNNDLVLISDFNKKISEIVASESVPYIYERVGEFFEHYFIDEFQDTSVMQWNNLLPLVDNSLANGAFNLIVGDAKQAIYRWRNGNVEQFIKLPYLKEDLLNSSAAIERQASLIREFSSTSLNTNYRSDYEIVHFNNLFFNFISESLGNNFKEVYKNLAQKSLNDSGGYVCIDFIANSKMSDYEELTCNRILEIIINASSRFEYSEMAILCRTNKYAQIISEFLLNNSINVVSVESLRVDSSPKVNFLVSLMLLILNPKDEIALTSCIDFISKRYNTPFHQNVLDLLDIQRQDDSFTIENIINFYQLSSETSEVDRLWTLDVYNVLEYCVRLFGLNVENDPFIVFFLDVAADFSAKNKSGIQSFLEYWSENKEKLYISVPDSDNAINVLTIHKAKGLEFPMVIYAFADEKVELRGEMLWYKSAYNELQALEYVLLPVKKGNNSPIFDLIHNEELERKRLDMTNLLYVALTRSRNELYILCMEPKKTEKSSKHELDDNESPSDFAFPKLLQQFLKQQGLYSEETVYHFGNPRPFKEAILKNSYKNCFYNRIISSNWQVRTRIKSINNSTDKQDLNNPLILGSLKHKVLSYIDVVEDLPNAISKIEASENFNKPAVEDLYKQMESLLNLPELKPYFRQGLKIFKEVEILLPNGNSYIPDRVVDDGRLITIIEFKTGSVYQANTTQLETYYSIVKTMTNKPVEAFLFYIDLLKLIKL